MNKVCTYVSMCLSVLFINNIIILYVLTYQSDGQNRYLCYNILTTFCYTGLDIFASIRYLHTSTTAGNNVAHTTSGVWGTCYNYAEDNQSGSLMMNLILCKQFSLKCRTCLCLCYCCVKLLTLLKEGARCSHSSCECCF